MILPLSSSGFWGKTILVASSQRLPCAEIHRWTLDDRRKTVTTLTL